MLEWNSLYCENECLQLETNLTCGQSFRWRICEDSTVIGVFAHRVWLIKQEGDIIQYKVLACLHWAFNQNRLIKYENRNNITDSKSKKCESLSERKRKHCNKDVSFAFEFVKTIDRECNCQEEEKALLEEYLHFKVDLKKLYFQWNTKDTKFTKAASKYPGIRILRQDPTETLFSFLCSVNNSMSRIVSMIEKMCKLFGTKLLEIEGECFYDFPSLNKLSGPHIEQQLRDNGFGYRASFIEQSATKVLLNGGSEWLNSLRHETYDSALAQLVQLPGVGMKVADCVCLMSLDKFEAVPVDTHVRQLAIRDYNLVIKSKSLTNKSYESIGNFFRSLWGSYAGWAQAVLFVAETKPLPNVYAFPKTLPPSKKDRKIKPFVT